jgi:hypothetical protein
MKSLKIPSKFCESSTDGATSKRSSTLTRSAEVRQTLDRRYDDIKSGRVALIDGEESRARLREKHQTRRAKLLSRLLQGRDAP